jgi:hypothetical protein
LVTWEIELDVRLKDKTLRIESQQRQILQITDGEEEKIAKLTRQSAINQQQVSEHEILKTGLAELKGLLSAKESEIQYLRTQASKPTQHVSISGGSQTGINLVVGDNFSISNQFNYQQLITETEKETKQSLTNQVVTEQDQKVINRTIIFLGAKELFINYRQTIINHLIEGYCKLTKQNKTSKFNTASGLMGITNKLAGLVPGGAIAQTSVGILGDTIDLAGTIHQEKNLKQCLKKLQEILTKDKKALTLFDEYYQPLGQII